MKKWVPEQPRPWRKSCERESRYGDRVYTRGPLESRSVQSSSGQDFSTTTTTTTTNNNNNKTNNNNDTDNNNDNDNDTNI